ncbi:O-antigen ligase family protein [Thiobacillus sedimenti]|uniref:O-antigen ligase family protein n=1 Tax=Thiobacillus sedimenti TaxID=3110231 RepID=A0ABZ1CHN7_9PROT|nr:O-antigen ligase family protein [Thiobacillus sp. SCUT-2]WRS38721.1 O-antigen ligase family protein [Thiobacillus sp. SCUT-2]
MRLKLPTDPIYVILIGATVASGFVFVGAALTGLLLLIWVALVLRRTFACGRWPVYPMSVWMLVYLAWLAVVTVSSAAANVSWLTSWVLAGLPIAYLAWGITRNSTKIWNALRVVLLLTGPVFALWGLGQVISGFGNGQPIGPLVDKNAFAALLNLFWFMGSAHFIGRVSDRGPYWRLVPAALGLLLIAMTLFAAESRGATLTWLLLMPILLWAGYRNTRNKPALVFVLAIALTGYTGAATLLGLNVGHRTLNLEADASASARLHLWKSAALIARDHPIAGTGWGTFAAQYPAYRDPRENTTAGRYAHNDYIQLTAEGGVPALVLMLGIFAGLVVQLKRSVATKPNSHAMEATGLLLAVLALFIHASLNFIFYFAFMNVLAGLLAARAVQLSTTTEVVHVNTNRLSQIGRATKLMVAGFMALLLAGPLLLQLLAQSVLTGAQPGLALMRMVWPAGNAYQVAKLISAVRPSSGIAQEVMLQASEAALKDSDVIRMSGGNFQRELLRETLDRYELVRAQTANSPAYGVREARTLIQYRDLLDAGVALTRAREILMQNLRVDPFHVDSMIALSRLDVAERHLQQAQQLLAVSMQHVLSRRDQQLLVVELLRQRAAPRQIPELDLIERKLRAVRSDSETGKPLILDANFSEGIDMRLKRIADTL